MSWEMWVLGLIISALLFWIGFLLLGISDDISSIGRDIDRKINPPRYYDE